MSNDIISIALHSMQNYTAKEVKGILVFPYCNVYMILLYNGNIMGSERYNHYLLNRLVGEIFYLITKDNDGNINLKVGKLSTIA